MKKKLTIGSIIAAVTCFAQSKKEQFAFPPEMNAAVKVEFQKQCEQGKILYELNCARCHTKTVNGRKQLPQFTETQLSNYELRIANPVHADSLSEERVSAEELGYIQKYFQYRKG